uniref:Transmembrane protein n=1 Tax=Heterorhabditis bacteriophora TaxID=37862 RepID=A0A1I7X752_HETBA
MRCNGERHDEEVNKWSFFMALVQIKIFNPVLFDVAVSSIFVVGFKVSLAADFGPKGVKNHCDSSDSVSLTLHHSFIA